MLSLTSQPQLTLRNKGINFFLALFFSHTCIYANTINGFVKDSVYQPVDVATVSLFRLPDSSFVKAEFTNADGSFAFVEIPSGEYFLHVSFLGFKDYRTPAFTVVDGEATSPIPEIILQGEGQTLKEIKVVAQKPFIERKSDRLIVNVENSILAAGASGMEVLERAPGIIVTAGEAISIRGRQGVIFMIDGKVTPMSGQELTNYLKAMPAGSIERIEIITNPSAKYDAAGNAGIIDIRLKKEANMGTNGTFNMSYSQGVYPKSGLGLSLNRRSKDLNLFGGYNYSYREGFNELHLYRAFFEDGQRTGAYDQDNYMVIPYHFHSLRFGADYSISPSTIVGVLVNGSINTFEKEGQNKSLVENELQEVVSAFTTDSKSDEQWPSYAVNGNIKHVFPKGKQELTADFDFAEYRNESDQAFITRYYDLNGEEYLPFYLLTGDLTGNLNIRSFKTDYAAPIQDKAKLEAGLKTSHVEADNNLEFYDESEIDHPVFDSTISNHFIYDERINAAYLNFHYNWPKLSLQSGLRVEQTIADGIQLINGESFKRNYTNVFPSVFLQYTFSDQYAMGVNMSRRLDRPSYQQLNPFKYYLDPSTYREGNPYLNPQFTWSFEWNHTLYQKYTATLAFARTTQNITQVIAPVEGEDRVTVQTDKNLDEVEYLSLSAGIPVSIGKGWSSQNSISCYLSRYYGEYADTELNNGNVVLDVRTNNTFILGNDWSAELNFSYHTREIYAFMDLEPMWALGAGIQKQLFNNRSTLKFTVTDIFWTNLPAAFIQYTNYEENFDVYRDTRLATVSYVHRFGDSQVAPSRRRSGGAEEEKSRAGQGVQG
jgi:hypothetical protein